MTALFLFLRWTKIAKDYIIISNTERGVVATVETKPDDIKVLQVALTGTTKPGKWYIQRGDQYLSMTDHQWYDNTSTGGFFFESEAAANAAKMKRIEMDQESPPP